MSWEFKVGMKVVCVDDMPPPKYWDGTVHAVPLRKGETYTLRWVGAHDFHSDGLQPAVKVVGVYRPDPEGNPDDRPFAADRFRPLVSKPDAIEQFREIARGVSNGKPIIDDPIPTKRVLEEMTP